MLGPKFRPESTWVGFHMPAQYQYADIYPVFIGANVARANGAPFVVPVTPGHSFQGRPAIQVSRRNSAAQSGLQKVGAKILKVLDFLEVAMTNTCRVRMARRDFDVLMNHLFPGDHDEHGAVLLAGVSCIGGLTLHVREVHLGQRARIM
jgi:hypothetical protein